MIYGNRRTASQSYQVNKLKFWLDLSSLFLSFKTEKGKGSKKKKKTCFWLVCVVLIIVLWLVIVIDDSCLDYNRHHFLSLKEVCWSTNKRLGLVWNNHYRMPLSCNFQIQCLQSFCLHLEFLLTLASLSFFTVPNCEAKPCEWRSSIQPSDVNTLQLIAYKVVSNTIWWLFISWWWEKYYTSFVPCTSGNNCSSYSYQICEKVWWPQRRYYVKILEFRILLWEKSRNDENKYTNETILCFWYPQGKLISRWSGLYRFSKGEIEKAINYGNTKVRLGSGSAGQVYQGILPSRQLVAIKHIYKTAMSGSFMREVEGLSKIRHPNLVALLGFCDEGGEQYLVYEYCCNGNLAQNLLSKLSPLEDGHAYINYFLSLFTMIWIWSIILILGSDSVLSWDQRVKILRDCALVLRFLHFHPDGCIVHRDIKVTNNFQPIQARLLWYMLWLVFSIIIRVSHCFSNYYHQINLICILVWREIANFISIIAWC